MRRQIPKISIAKGNTKLGGVPNISLPPIKACGNCQGCKKTCYALRAWRMYKQTRAAWSRNHKIALTNPNEYFTQINNFITRTEPRFFRWHVSGDILDQHYLDEMKVIAELHPDTKFLCFTKMYSLNYSLLPTNLKIVFSAWPGVSLGNRSTWFLHMPIAWMYDADNIDARIPKTAKECPGNCETCNACWHLNPGESVVFHKH